MIKTIVKKIDELIEQVKNPNYREFLRLLYKYRNIERNKPVEIKFLNYKITAADVLSFIYQFKEIFVNEAYKFRSDSASPFIFDCGANIGISCLYFKKIFPSARIIAFEADPQIAAVLEKNLTDNNIHDIKIINKAVWINNEGVEFNSDGRDGGSIFGQGNKFKIDSVNLKEYISAEEQIDFLKMDIEGAEVDVLNDCAEILYKVKMVFVEYHGWKKSEHKLDELLNVLRKNKFKYYIEPVNKLESPLERTEQILNLDLQLNIFAINYR